MRITSFTLGCLVVGAAACGGGGGSNPQIDSPAAQHDAPATHDAAKVFMDAPAGTFPLQIHNIISWCDVSVNGGTPSPSSLITANVLPGEITVSAVAHMGFELGPTPWHDVDGDTGTGVQGTLSGSGQTQASAAKVTITTAGKCVWVCCRSTVDPTDCDVPDPCN
jgi:hypothetical protein